MSKVMVSLNFMYCMERFATQIYKTQKGVFHDSKITQQLQEASENENTHVQKLRSQIKKLKGTVYPFGWLFQGVGVILGGITRLTGKRNLFRADTFVENRAVKDYSSFVKSVPYDEDTVKLLRDIIADEEIHIKNWKAVADSFKNK